MGEKMEKDKGYCVIIRYGFSFDIDKSVSMLTFSYLH